MKKLLIVLCFVLLLSGCSKPTNETETPSETNTAELGSSEETKALEAIGEVEVDEGLFDVTLQIPIDFTEEGKTQEDYDNLAKENGWKSITLNDDGSLTYVLTKAQHSKLMETMSNGLQESLDEMINSENFPNITKIEVNDDYLKYKVTTKSEVLDTSESFSVLTFYMMSGMYHVFNGTTLDNVNVVFINEDSGEIIEEANSEDMDE